MTFLEYAIPGILTFVALLFPAILRTLVFDVSTYLVKTLWRILRHPLTWKKSTKKQSKKDSVRFVQTLNPKTGRYMKIDRDMGEITSEKKSKGPYKNVPIIKK